MTADTGSARLDQRVADIVAAWPQLSDEQVDRIAALLRAFRRPLGPESDAAG
jgi:hypothetical protein